MSEEFLESLREIERKWQRRWAEAGIFEADPDPTRPKFYLTVAYPYPNSPQHVGHGRTYGITDAYARYKRMRGYNVLLPMAFHYTGTPILAMAERIQDGEEELIRLFREVYGVPEDKIREFTDPLRLARYFHEEIKEGMRLMGYSIDWRREFTTIDPAYNRFIEWQFRRLASRGYLVKGRHPVGWCPRDDMAVGQHDTKGDVEPEIEEVTVIKFRLEDGTVFPVATFRPETVYGVTNLWVNPDVEYAVAQVGGERWVVSDRGLLKLGFQGFDAREVGRIGGAELVGRWAENPATGERVPVLPARFVDPDYGTGLVMSVPGHAPYDYLALRDLKRNPDPLRGLGIDPSILAGIEPISIIRVEGYSELPARDAVESRGIEDQSDPEAEEATKEVYRAEYHSGVMRENVGRYAGLPVSEAKEEVRRDLEAAGKAFRFYEVANRPVYCRCGAEVVVKVVEDQWFIDYSNPGWKEDARRLLSRMRILPEALRGEFQDVIEWVREKACARSRGLGTRLPMDPRWVIESLSDSTIYMAYYTISHRLRRLGVDPDRLGDYFFDYVMLGEGDPASVAERLGIPEGEVRAMREEFLYWYPLDSRHSGRDLVWNHLTFFVFNHAAVFPEELWPRQIVVNGSVLMEGQKMSKTLGNIIPIRDAVREFGADPIRVTIMGAADLMSDADFKRDVARSTLGRLERLLRMARRYGGEAIPPDPSSLGMWDRWMLSTLQRRIAEATEAMESCETRRALLAAFYNLGRDVSKYLQAVDEEAESTRRVMATVMDAWIRLLAPFAPHVAEEAWSSMGRDGFVSLAPWPEEDENLIDERAEKMVEVIDRLVEDARTVMRTVGERRGRRPERLRVYVAAGWKYDLFRVMEEAAERSGRMDPPTLIRAAAEAGLVAGRDREVSGIARTYAKAGGWTWLENRDEEIRALEEGRAYISGALGVEVAVATEEEPGSDPEGRAARALPGRPALYLE